MGFYGNITNTSRTQFQFDQIYTSRKQMDDAAESDGIYAGRYVLVNYEEEGGSDYYIHAYKVATQEGFQFGASVNGEQLTRFRWVATAAEAKDVDVVFNGEVIAIPPDHVHNKVDPESDTWEFWRAENYTTITIPSATPGAPDEEIKYAVFTQYADLYSLNYNIDVENYRTSRGYDSTVWQKTYQSGVDKYVMVAELNTVVPTFDLEADAPKMVPLTPHFDADSTNVYYKLHWSPSWGFRVKAANPELTGPILTDNGENAYSGRTIMTSDSMVYPSDETTKWFKTSYDRVNTTTEYIFSVNEEGTEGKWLNVDYDKRPVIYDNNGNPVYQGSELMREAVIEPQAAIYYNKNGFNPEFTSYGYREVTGITADNYEPNIYYKKVNGNFTLANDLTFTANQKYYEKIEDHILIQPTGISGHVYNAHNGSITDTVQEDTQELSIMLPALGNTIAAIWDLIYGGEEINDGPKRNLDISWEKARAGMDRHGLRLVTDFNIEGQYLYKTKNVDTIAGALNSVHDLLGMIITSASYSDLMSNINALSENRIYYDETHNTFNRKTKVYNYTNLDENDYLYEEVTITSDEYSPGVYLIEDNGHYVVDNRQNFTVNETYYLRKVKPNQEYVRDDRTFSLFNGMNYAYKDFTGISDDFYYEYQPINATDYDNGIYYIKQGNDFIQATGNFDDTKTYYKKIEAILGDYVRDPKFHKDKTYYEWNNIEVTTFTDLSDVYEKNKYYYKDGQGNYKVSQMDQADTNVQYLALNPEKLLTLADIPKDGVYVPGKYLYEDPPRSGNYQIDSNPTMTSGRAYYLLDTSQTTVDNEVYTRIIEYTLASYLKTDPSLYVKDVYYLWNSGINPNLTPGSIKDDDTYYILCRDETYDSNINYYIREEKLVKAQNSTYYKVDGSQAYTLIQFHENEFFIKDPQTGDFNVLTRLSDTSDLEPSDIYMLRSLRQNTNSNNGTYIITNSDHSDRNVCAMINQDKFYEPGKFHYLSDGNLDGYTDYILDTYPTKTHDTYYQIRSIGQPVDLNQHPFFDAYEYYSLNSVTGEYTLITDDSVLPSGDIYKRDALYITNDEAHIYPKNAIWNSDAVYVPASLTLAKRTESFGLAQFEDFARTINTMHGMLLRIKKVLDEGNEDTRDLRTVQGCLNTLADKIAQFDTWAPGQPLIADNYGRIHGAQKIETEWTKIEIDPKISSPGIKVTHKFNPIADTNHTTDLTTSTGTITFDEVKSLIDTTGHVVGKHTETYQLPHGYGIITGDSGSLAAGGSYATIKLEGSDNWIQTEATTESNVKKIKITHEFHAGTNVTNAAIDFETNTDAKFTATKPIPDDKGHIVAWESTEYQLPHSYGSVLADSGSALAAASTYDSITFEGDGSWISTATGIANEVKKITIAHSNPVTIGATLVGPATAQSPGFGGNFNIPSFSIDAKGHVAITGTQTVNIPQMSVSSGINSITNSVLTDISYDNAGTFIKTSIAPQALVLTGYVPDSTVIVRAITSTDTIGSALNMLEKRIISTENTIGGLDVTTVTAGTGEVISSVGQENGQIAVTKKSLTTSDLPLNSDFVYNTITATNPGEEDVEETTSIIQIAKDLTDLEDTVINLDLFNENTQFTYTPTIPANITAFWTAYDTWLENNQANEDGYVEQEVTSEDYQNNTFYVLNEEYNPEDENSEKYILDNSGTYDSEQTYFLPFTDLLAEFLATESEWNDIYTAGRPVQPAPQTWTVKDIITRLLAIEAALTE